MKMEKMKKIIALLMLCYSFMASANPSQTNKSQIDENLKMLDFVLEQKGFWSCIEGIMKFLRVQNAINTPTSSGTYDDFRKQKYMKEKQKYMDDIKIEKELLSLGKSKQEVDNDIKKILQKIKILDQEFEQEEQNEKDDKDFARLVYALDNFISKIPQGKTVFDLNEQQKVKAFGILSNIAKHKRLEKNIELGCMLNNVQ